MSKVLIESSTYTTSVTVPEDGDDITGSSVEVQAQALANRTKYLKAANESTQADLDTLESTAALQSDLDLLEATVGNGQWQSFSAHALRANALAGSYAANCWTLAGPVLIGASGAGAMYVELSFPNSASFKRIQLLIDQTLSTGTRMSISGVWYNSSLSTGVSLSTYTVSVGSVFTVNLYSGVMSGADGGVLMLQINPPSGGSVALRAISTGYALGGIN